MFKQYISSNSPAHIIIILDQSSRMSEPYCNGMTKAEYVTNQVNEFINNLILMCCNGDKIKDWFCISLVSHSNNQARIIESKYLSEIANNPLKTKKINKKVSDGIGGLVEIEVERVEYIEVVCTGESCLVSAFKCTQDLILGWAKKKTHLSTLIINMSGGYSSEWEITNNIIEDIKSITFNDEQPFLFNLLLDNYSNILDFPSLVEIYDKSFTNQLYFGWSSFMSKQMSDSCKRYEFNVRQGSKLYSNIGIDKVLNLINVGS